MRVLGQSLRRYFWVLLGFLLTSQIIFAQSKATLPKASDTPSLTPASFSTWSGSNKAMDKKLILALVEKVVATSAPLPLPPPPTTMLGRLSSMASFPTTLASLKSAVTSAWSDTSRWEAAANCIVRAVESSLNAKQTGKKGSSGLSASEKNVDSAILGSICAKAIAQMSPTNFNKDKAIEQQSTASNPSSPSAQKLNGFARCISFALGTGVAGAYVPPPPPGTAGAAGTTTATPAGGGGMMGMMMMGTKR